jgi:protein TonB
VKLKAQHNPPLFQAKILIPLLLAFAGPLCVRAQTPAQTPTPTQAPTPAPTEQVTSEAQDQPQTDASAVENSAEQQRLAHARSLAAIGKLSNAASELESLRMTTKDDSVREVSRLMLMTIYVEMSDYGRASSLLDDAYRAHTPGRSGDEAMHSYFALAGQTVNSVRAHLERFRSYGVSIADAAAVSPEANGDMELLRGLLEKVVAQAKALHEEQEKGGESTKGMDAAALLEDAATVRMRIARADDDRARWQSEVSDARQHLFSSEMRIASISDVPSARAAAAKQPAANTAPPATADKTTQPKSEPKTSSAEQRPTVAEQKSDKKSRQKTNDQKSGAASTTQNTPPTQTPAQQQQAASAPTAGAADASAKNNGSPVSVGSLAGKAKQRVAPSYPSIARTARISGIVTVYLVVNEKGEVESVERATGPMQLQQAATDAARRWKFAPTVVDGQPVRVAGFLSFNFTL